MKFTRLFPKKRSLRGNGRDKKLLRNLKMIASGWLHSHSRVVFMLIVAVCLAFVYLGTINNVNIYVDGDLKKQVSTTSRTVGELFTELEFETHDKDKINRAPGERLVRNDNIYIEKAFPVFVAVDNSVLEVWTTKLTVGELLVEQGINLGIYDKVNLDLSEKLEAYEDIKIVRIEKIYTAHEASIPYESVYRDNPSLDRGMSRVISQGEKGVKKETVEIVMADGEEMSREIVEERIVEPPRNKIIENGTREIVKPEINQSGTKAIAPGTDINFKKSFNMNATAYCPGTAGSGCPTNSAGHSHCTGQATGRTSTGAPAVAGEGSRNNPHIIAVDPRVIPLHSMVYIDGYGYAVAKDTGGGVRGNKIDILFATHQEALRFGRRSLKVYLLD